MSEPRRPASRAWLRAVVLLPLAALATELALRVFAGPLLDPGSEHQRLQLAGHRALFQLDAHCIEGLRADLQILFPPRAPGEAPEQIARRHPIEIRTNSTGLRMREISPAREPGSYRIAILGDSVTFGWNVEEARCFPRVLECRLRRRAGEAGLEVLNFGVPGYSTLQGQALLREKVALFAPDLLVVAFGFNDWALRASEPDAVLLARRRASASATLEARWWIEESAIARLLRRWSGADGWPGAPGRTHSFNRRVPPGRARAALAELIETARAAGCEVVLANLCFPNARAGDLLRAVARTAETPFFDGRAVLLARNAPGGAPPARAPARGECCLLEVRLSSARHEQLVRAGEEILALALPPDALDSTAQLNVVALTAWRQLTAKEGILHGSIDLSAGCDWALVPRSYLEAAPREIERLSNLYYHRLPGGPASAPERLRVELGVFLETRYGSTDVPFNRFMAGEAIHPNAAGHALLAARLEEFLRSRCISLSAWLEEARG